MTVPNPPMTTDHQEHIEDVAMRIHQTACDHGWWDKPRSAGDSIALMHSELSEALEEYRANPNIQHTYLRESDGKPEGVAFELADCIIRILDFCEYHDLNIAAALLEKMEFNESRPYRHGGKAL